MVKVTADFSIGDVGLSYTAEGEDAKDVLEDVFAITSWRRKCNECKNDDPKMFKGVSNRGGGHKFVNVMCLKCGAKSQLGSYLNGGGHFWKDHEKYVKKED